MRGGFGAVPLLGLLSPLETSQRAHGRIRTCDARFRKPTLYPLSYVGMLVVEAHDNDNTGGNDNMAASRRVPNGPGATSTPGWKQQESTRVGD